MLETLLQRLPNVLLTGGAFLFGLLVKYCFDLYKGRISRARYRIDKAFLGASAHDAFFGKVQVLYNNHPVQNLYLCNATLVNESRRDFEDVKVTVWCDEDSLILVSSASKTDSIRFLSFTEDYTKEQSSITDETIKDVLRRREFAIPVFNRRDQLSFVNLVTNDQREEPELFLHCEHQGLRLSADWTEPAMLWGERQNNALLWGLVITILGLIGLIHWVESATWLVVSAYIAGLMCLFPGWVMVKLLRILKSIVD